MDLGADAVDGATGLNLCLLQWAVAREQPPRAAVALALRIAALPRPALTMAMELIAAAGKQDLRGFVLEREAGGQLLDTSEAQSLYAGFLAKSTKEF